MKKLSIIIFIVGLVGLFSCKKDETKVDMKTPPDAAVLNPLPGGDNVTLLLANQDAMIDYTWAAADYGAPVVTAYALEMDKEGNKFADALTLGTVNSATKVSVLTSTLNAALLGMEADPSVPDPVNVEFRVKASVPNYPWDVSKSNVIKQTITPYYVKVTYPILGVPGSYQGWNPADSSTSIASVKSNGKYEGYINFPDAGTKFKFTQGPSWDNNWGDNGDDGTLDQNGADILAADAGYYKLNVDLPNLTYTKLKTTWAVIGSATPGGWDADTPMTYDATAKVWTVTIDLTADELKFRANGAWDLNYGDNNANGGLQEGGANIKVPSAGNYTINLNLSGPIYKYTLKKN
jgi:starch-binding outer membrane protein SusE/F